MTAHKNTTPKTTDTQKPDQDSPTQDLPPRAISGNPQDTLNLKEIDI